MHPLTAPVYQTAFPATSEAPLPDPRLFDTPMDFRLQTTGKGLDWIYHLTAQRRREGEASASLIPKVPLTRLEALLKTLAEELGVRGNYLVQARECFHGQEPFCQGGCTGKAYHPNTTWNGRSHELALVIALFAASEDHPIALPDWVMFSGALKRGSLRLGDIGGLIEKTRIALGRERGAEHIEPLMREMYCQGDRGSTERCIGPQSERVFPPKIKMLIVGRCDVEGLAKHFPGKVVKVRPEKYRSEKPERVYDACVKRDARDGLLVVEVPSVHEALCLLGMRPPRRKGKKRVRELRAYRIDPSLMPDPISDWANRGRYLRAVYESIRKAKPSAKENLETLLRLCCVELNNHLRGQVRCFSGDVALVPAADSSMLRVEARWGKDADAIPYYYPATIGITRRALWEGKTQEVPDTSKDRDFEAAQSVSNPVAGEYPPATWQRYRAFLDQIKSCVKIPIRNGDEVTAVLSLHCNKAVDYFDEDSVVFLTALAQMAREPVRVLLTEEQPPRNPSGTETGSYRKVIERSFSGYLTSNPSLFDSARKELCQELAALALRRAEGAYRTAVRTLSPDGGQLEVQATVGEFHPTFFDKDRHPVRSDEAKSASDHAIRHLLHSYIQDTERAEVDADGRRIPIEPFGPVCARAHASVLILYGTHVLGVLSVDWREPRHIPSDLRDDLEQLACRYALALKSLLADTRLSELREAVKDPDLGRFVRLTGEVIGARYVALYRQNRNTGEYELDVNACVGHTADWLASRHTPYASGESFIGWVVKKRQGLRVADRNRPVELAKFNPPPKWRDGQDLDREWGERVVAWMGVPVRVGNEILGVLRFATENRNEGFSSFDQSTAEASAALLGEHFFEQQELPRRARLLTFAAGLQAVTSPRDVSRRLFAFLKETINPYAGGIRLLDQEGCADGTLRPAMRRLKTTDGAWWNQTPLFRLPGLGVTDWVCKNKRRYLSSDPALPTVEELGIDAGTRALLAEFKEHACYPLFGEGHEVIGTLHLARKTPGSLAAVDAFCAELAGLVGPTFARLHREEPGHLELALLRIGRLPSEDRTREALALLVQHTDAHVGVFWEKIGSTQMFAPLHVLAAASGNYNLHAADVGAALGNAGARLVSNPEHDAALAALCQPVVAELPSWRLKDCHQAAIAQHREGNIGALYVLISPPNVALSYRSLIQAHRLLQETNFSQ